MPYREWRLTDFSGGMVDKVDNNLLKDNASPACQNVASNKIGTLTQRRGYARLNATSLGGPIQGLYPYYYGANRKLVTVSNGTAYYWDGSVWQQIKSGLNASAQVYFETCVNYMVAFNGVDAPWKYDGNTVSALANAPATGKFGVLYKEKLFTVDTVDESTLVFSDSFEPETWPAVNFLDFGKGDGDIITAAINYLGSLTVFKNYSIYELAGTTLDDFRISKLEGRIGCVGPLAVTNYGMYLFFIGRDGIYQWNGSRAVNLVSNVIPELWKAVNQEYLHNAAIGTWDDKVWCSVTAMSHRKEDTVNTVSAANASNEDTLITLVNSIRAAYEAHRVDAANYHYLTDTENIITLSPATDLATAYSLALELKSDFNSHLSSMGHVTDDLLNMVTTADPTGSADLPGCIALANSIKSKFNLHLTKATSTTNNLVLVYDVSLQSWWPWRGINAA
jgi:hypothetical protein